MILIFYLLDKVISDPDNICEVSNPCENNGTCIFDPTKKNYFCKCTKGYTNDNCTERIGKQCFGYLH